MEIKFKVLNYKNLKNCLIIYDIPRQFIGTLSFTASNGVQIRSVGSWDISSLNNRLYLQGNSENRDFNSPSKMFRFGFKSELDKYVEALNELNQFISKK